MGVEAEHQTDDEQTMQLLQFAVGLNSSKGWKRKEICKFYEKKSLPCIKINLICTITTF